ncbi:ParB/RepB/Spo0J family partition protein [Acinetobacter baumannii]|nr:ParB/RepB/Spo0J family partition protein [Acinetobacter baumannii]HCW5914769.1 ParB/RepB/Spo0J family partition protein [Acinetobacter baumannii]
MSEPKKKGLDALKGAVSKLHTNNLAAGDKIHILAIDDVQEDPNNPRKKYNEEKIVELALSIAAVDQLQPISVRDNPEEKGKYLANFGSSRIRAIRWLKENMPDHPNSSTIKAVINNNFRKMGKLVENVQREGLTAFEIGMMLKEEVEETGITPKEICSEVGKDKTWVSRHLKVAEVSEYVKSLINEGVISNVEVILNVEKLYKENADKLKATVDAFLFENKDADIRVVTLAESRKWLKEAAAPIAIESNQTNSSDSEEPTTIVIEHDEQNNDGKEPKQIADSHSDQGGDTDSFKLTETDSTTSQEQDGEIHEIEPNDYVKIVINDKNGDGEKPAPKDSKTSKEKLSAGLKKEYANGALVGYRHLYEMATESEDEIEAKLSKVVLKSFAGQSLALNWSEIGEYPDLLEEVGQILASFQSVGFVPPSALNDEEVNNLISQEDLI